MNAYPDDPELFPDVDAAAGLRAAFKRSARASANQSQLGPTATAERPSKLHGYELQGELARGGMGVIVKAYDRGLGRAVALKVLHEELAHEPKLVRRFLEEARVTARLDHPGIVPVHEVGFDAHGHAFFAMRLVRGRDLRRIIELAQAEQEGWNITRALSAMLKVCEAMAYAHERGVIHRDLKPSNIMVGEFGEVYVMDWGLARVIGSADARDLRLRTKPERSSAQRDPHPPTRPHADDGARRTDNAREEFDSSIVTPGELDSPTVTPVEFDSPIVTMDGEVLGTPCYMAPEQAQGRIHELGPRSDVYSTGALLYHLLAGELPYVPAGTSVASRTVLLRLVEGPPRPLHELRPELAPELVAICEKAMARAPAQRYPDMLAMAHDLRAFLERRVVSAYETGAWAQARKWIVRNKPLSAALAGVVGALAVGLVVSMTLKARSDANAARAERNAHFAQDERDRALKIASFLEDTLGGVRPAVAVGRDTALLRDLMDSAWLRIERGELSAAPQAELRLRLVIGNAYNDIAQYDKAEPILRQALAQAASMFAGDDELKARSLTALYNCCRDQSKLEEAESLAREALALRRRMSSGDDRGLAGCIENLAAVQEARGDLVSAEAGLREALAMFGRLSPGDDRWVALTMHNLAVVLAARGDAGGAQEFGRQAVAMFERLRPGDQQELAASLDSLGASLQRTGDLAAAEPLLRRGLEMRRRLYSADHPDLAASMNNLAALLRALGQKQDAEALLREVLDMQRRLFKGDHALLASSLINLAAMLQQRGDPGAAEPMLREALAMQKRLFAGDHASIVSGLFNLGMLLKTRGDLAGAERFLREALEMQQRLFPGDQADSAMMLANLATLLRARGDLAGAIASQREAVRMRQQLSSGDSFEVAKSLGGLAWLLEQSGELAEAQSVLRETLRMTRAVLPANDASIANTELYLGRVLGKQRRFAEADETLRSAYRDLTGSDNARLDWRVECVQLILANQAAWDASEPDQGHADGAARWQNTLGELKQQ